MRLLSSTTAMLMAFLNCMPVLAASSDWLETDGARIRLVTAGGVEETGHLRGALEIVLEPGWKTYWLEPGDAGVPPQVDISASRGVDGVELRFPVPQRFDDGYAVWAGYKESVAIALDFAVSEAPLINADVFLGVCKDICIPVQAVFSVDPDPANDTSEEADLIDAAFKSLPPPAGAEFGISEMKITADDTAVAVFSAPESGAAAELFIASSDGWYFGIPALAEDGRSFSIAVLGRPKTLTKSSEFEYTLVSGDAAVSGTVAIHPAAGK